MSSVNPAKQRVFILDTHAVIAYLEGEAGEAQVSEILGAAQREEQLAVLTLINLGEVLYITERERGFSTAQDVLAAIQQLPIQVLEVDRKLVLSAAHIKANYPVSYGNAFVIAAAQELDGTILTGDREFRSVEDLVSVEWLPA